MASTAGITGCSSDGVASGIVISAHCTTDQQWAAVPTTVIADRIGSVLRVPAEEVRTGQFGPANCTTAISQDAIPTDYPPIVSIDGKAHACMVIGTVERPKAGTMSKQIFAICPSTAGVNM